VRLSPRARLGNDALSHQAKAGVEPIEKPERRKKGPKGLARTQMERKPSRLKKTPLGHASPEQKSKVEREGPRIDHTVINLVDLIEQFPDGLGPIDPAHITPRSHGGCDHEDCVCPLPRRLHTAFDEGKLDLLPWLTLDEQAHAVKHLGILGALKRTTGELYIPESVADLRVEAVYREAGA
jgi:hypothetical protein